MAFRHTVVRGLRWPLSFLIGVLEEAFQELVFLLQKAIHALVIGHVVVVVSSPSATSPPQAALSPSRIQPMMFTHRLLKGQDNQKIVFLKFPPKIAQNQIRFIHAPRKEPAARSTHVGKEWRTWPFTSGEYRRWRSEIDRTTYRTRSRLAVSSKRLRICAAKACCACGK